MTVIERERDALVHRIAAELDMPSVYMGGPSLPSKRKAARIVDILPGTVEASLDAADAVTRQYHMQVIEGLVRERDEARGHLAAVLSLAQCLADADPDFPMMLPAQRDLYSADVRRLAASVVAALESRNDYGRPEKPGTAEG